MARYGYDYGFRGSWNREEMQSGYGGNFRPTRGYDRGDYRSGGGYDARDFWTSRGSDAVRSGIHAAYQQGGSGMGRGYDAGQYRMNRGYDRGNYGRPVQGSRRGGQWSDPYRAMDERMIWEGRDYPSPWRSNIPGMGGAPGIPYGMGAGHWL